VAEDADQTPEPGSPCAKCSDALMERIPGDGFSIQRCARCRGTWFEGTTFDKALQRTPPALLEDPPRPPDPALNAQKGTCPSCRTPMIKVNSLTSPRVVMDVCKVCGGKWLDGGEFVTIRGKGLLARLKRLFGY
jgi:Zn-finger nucleic acid-binding protein